MLRIQLIVDMLKTATFEHTKLLSTFSAFFFTKNIFTRLFLYCSCKVILYMIRIAFVVKPQKWHSFLVQQTLFCLWLRYQFQNSSTDVTQANASTAKKVGIFFSQLPSAIVKNVLAHKYVCKD